MRKFAEPTVHPSRAGTPKTPGRAPGLPAAPTLAAKVAALSRPQLYPEQPRTVATIETHMSWVFLTESHAYKLKKPVRYAFLNFRSIAARRRDGAAEVRLNRRLAGSVYRGLVPLVQSATGELRLGGRGRIVDWLVKMRRLPAERALTSMIARKAIDRPALNKAATILARFYNRLLPVRIAATAYRRRLRSAVRQNMRALATSGYRLSAKRLRRIIKAQVDFLERRTALFDERVRKGRIVEAHGDLRPDHMFLVKPNPVIIDCLEFNRDFRLLDPVDEIAYLALECERLGAPFVESIIFAEYTRVSGDSPPAELIAFYKSYRACLRAKLALWHLKEPNAAGPAHWMALARAYLQLAERHARRLA